MSPYPKDETHEAPAAEDRLVWSPRADGSYDADLVLITPRDLTEGTVEVGAVTISGGRIEVHLRVRRAPG